MQRLGARIFHPLVVGGGLPASPWSEFFPCFAETSTALSRQPRALMTTSSAGCDSNCPMKHRILIGIIISCALLSTVSTRATPLRLTVQPKGTNEVELTFGPIIPDCDYQILARTNGLDGHWMTFAGDFIGGSNKTITATCNMGGAGDLKGLTMETLTNWKFVAGCWEDSDGDGLPDMYEDLATRTDPQSGDDGYSDPDGDNWSNLQEMANDTDPLKWNQPAGRRSIDVRYDTNGAIVVKWSYMGSDAAGLFHNRTGRTPDTGEYQPGASTFRIPDKYQDDQFLAPAATPTTAPDPARTD